MSSPAENKSLSERLLLGTTRLASKTWPIAKRIFPEALEIDDNRSLWVSQTPDYQPTSPLRENISADLVIIGGGFTGTSTAYHFSRRYPEKRIVLLEAKTLANGASGRNGGMMLNWMPSMYGYSPEMTRRIYDMTWAGIQTIIDIIQRHQLPVSYRLDGTLTAYTDSHRAEAAQEEAELHQQIGIPMQFLDASALKQKLNLQSAYGAVLDPNSGQINGAQLVRALRPILQEQGVEIYEQTPVLAIQEGAELILKTPDAEIKAKAIVLATNGYTGKLGYFQDALFPLHSHVFATAPLNPPQLENLGWHGFAGYADDRDRIAYSSLTSEGNIVFGGGSNQAYAYLFKNRTVDTKSPNFAKNAFNKLVQTMDTYLPNSANLPVAHRWTGVLGITLNRTPIIGVRGEHRNIYYAIGYCGHGVTLANIAGQMLTDMYSNDDQQWRDFPFYQQAYAPIPPEPFRWIGYQMFTRLTGHSPRV